MTISGATDFLLVFVVLANLALLGGSRLTALIQIAAFQGFLLGLLPLLTHAGHWTVRLVSVAIVAAGLKGIVFPTLLNRALREANIRREVDPFIDFNPSLVAGVLALVSSFWLASRLVLVEYTLSRLTLPAAFFTIVTGLFLIICRRQALSQVLGYLIMENGIYILGMALVGEVPMLVELGVLMDAFVGVSVMGIAVYHINRAFDHMDVDKLTGLRD